MHVAFLIGSLGTGGAERTVTMLGNRLVLQGHRVTLLTFATATGDSYPLDPRIERQVLGLWGRSGAVMKPFQLIRRVRRLRSAIRRADPDVVVGFQTQESLMLVIARPGLRQRIVLSERTAFWMRRRPAFWKFLFRRIYRFSDAQVVQTAQIARRLEAETGARNVQVIPNAVAAEMAGTGPHVHPDDILPAEAKVLLLVGSKPRTKGFDLALQAFERFLATAPPGDWRLVFAGLPQENDWVTAQVDTHPLRDRIEAIGRVGNIGDWYDRAFAFLLPSRTEGMPNTLLEAMSRGTLCIAADCPTGPADLIEDGKNGFLVPVEDAQALAERLAAICFSDQNLQSVRQNASQILISHGIASIVATWLTVLSGTR